MAEDVENANKLEEQSSGGNKMSLIAIILVVLLSNGVWGAVYFMSGPGAAAQAAETEPQGSEGDSAAADADANGPVGELGPLHTIEPFVVNLNDPAGTRFLRIGVSLELPTESERKLVEARMVPLKDVLISELSSLDVEQLSSRRDKEELRENLLLSARKVTSRNAVRQVYFTEFMIQ